MIPLISFRKAGWSDFHPAFWFKNTDICHYRRIVK